MKIQDHALRTPIEILRRALEKETQARDFYESLAVGCATDFVQELLLTLQNEETKHMHMIQHLLNRLEAGHEVHPQSHPDKPI